jgi:universal stress protein A
MNRKPSGKPGEASTEAVSADPIPRRARPMRPAVLSIHKILVPIDYSEVSLKALDYALAFARQFKSEVLALHVVDDVPVVAGEPVVRPTDTGLPQVKDQAERRLIELAASKKRENLRIKTLLRSGSAPNEIIEAAREQEVDLIIVATHGLRGMKRFFLGSTTERVVRHAPCPVLVVREKGPEILTQNPE